MAWHCLFNLSLLTDKTCEHMSTEHVHKPSKDHQDNPT